MHARELSSRAFLSMDVMAVIAALAAALLVRLGVITHVPW
jgi:hypothetical protein